MGEAATRELVRHCRWSERSVWRRQAVCLKCAETERHSLRCLADGVFHRVPHGDSTV